jgi:hypothetical protein
MYMLCMQQQEQHLGMAEVPWRALAGALYSMLLYVSIQVSLTQATRACQFEPEPTEAHPHCA